jgi:hypothetical protein
MTRGFVAEYRKLSAYAFFMSVSEIMGSSTLIDQPIIITGVKVILQKKQYLIPWFFAKVIASSLLLNFSCNP